jgi:hypothetical protein
MYAPPAALYVLKYGGIVSYSVVQTFSTFCVAWATLAKFDLQVGSTKFNVQTEE